MTKVCKYCNMEFKTHHSQKIFCKRECKNLWFQNNKEKQKQYRESKAKNKGVQICFRCGVEFLNSEKRKYCSIVCSNKDREVLDYSDCKTKKERRAKYWRNYYAQPENRSKHIKRVGPLREKKSKEIREKFKKFKSKLKCSSCEEDHIATLDFHHVDKSSKDKNVSHLVGISASWENILKEIKKCIVLCSNCHRKLHYNENHST